VIAITWRWSVGLSFEVEAAEAPFKTSRMVVVTCSIVGSLTSEATCNHTRN